MRSIRMLTWLMLTLFVAVTSTWAKDTNVGTVAIVLTPPAHYCELVADEPADRHLLDIARGMMAGRSELLAAYADCAQLAALREKNQSLDNFAQYISVDQQLTVTEGDLAQICAGMRSEHQEITGAGAESARKRIEEIAAYLKINEVRSLGVVAEEAPSCYLASIANISDNTGLGKTMVILSANTLVRGKWLGYNLYAPYVDANTLTQMLVLHKRNVAALRTANE